MQIAKEAWELNEIAYLTEEEAVKEFRTSIMYQIEDYMEEYRNSKKK